MTPNTVLWIYIVLLVVGGLIGFLKAGSKISLNMSIGFAAALTICAINVLDAKTAATIADVLMAILLVVFGIRLAKTKKFTPSGMMLIATIAALALRHWK